MSKLKILNNAFESLAANAKKIQEKIVQDHMQLWDPGESYGPLWEASEGVSNCRGCGVEFQMPFIKRKHHCRLCAGVYCDSCCEFTDDDIPAKAAASSVADETAPVRVCDGCKRGETPGNQIKDAIRCKLETVQEKATDASRSSLESIQDKVKVKLSENLGIKQFNHPPSLSVHLSRGKAYENDNDKDSDADLPTSGYFELLNKSSEVCCIKLLLSGGNKLFEIPRPSYIAVPPGEYINGHFNPDENLELFLLYDNPNAVPTNKRVICDTRAKKGAKGRKISPCAMIDLFESVAVYTIRGKGKNVLLKYKGDAAVEPRRGNAISRIGLLNRLSGRRFAQNRIDFSTNVETVNLKFTITT